MSEDWAEVLGIDWSLADSKMFAEAFDKFMEKRGLKQNAGPFQKVNERRRCEAELRKKKGNKFKFINRRGNIA